MLSGYQMGQGRCAARCLMLPGYQIEQSLSRALRLIPPGNQIAQLAIVRRDLMQPCMRQSVVDGPCAI
jgi:hypothetical protein